MTELPALPLDAWRDTKTTLHLVCQMVGKVRLALMPKKNHWWHVPLYPSARGLTTRLVPWRMDGVELELDLFEHALRVSRTDGRRVQEPLEGRSVAEIHDALFAALDHVGVDVTIVGKPFDMPFDTPFADDDDHRAWDPAAVQRWWRVVAWSAGVFERFHGRFVGKQTPVHLFWHSFDLALTRFSGGEAPANPDADPVTREAYSHEVVSFGFWAGDDRVPFPAYYAYAAPEPEGLAEAPLEPADAAWQDTGRGHMAILPYEAVRTADRPDDALLAFLESAYRAGAEGAGWPVDRLANPFVAA